MTARPEVRDRATGTALTVMGESPKFRAYLDRIGPDIERVLPARMRVDDVKYAALMVSVKTPEILKCEPASITLAILRCARLGLDIGEDIHLVPVKGRCEAWPDYRGLIRLAREARIVNDMVPKVVYQGDEYRFKYGLEEDLVHIPCAVEQRGPMIAAWCRITLPGARVTFHQMPIEDIEVRRKQSRTWSKEPKCPEWYAMKTVIRDWLNRQPKGRASATLAMALATGEDEPEAEARPAGVTVDGEILPGSPADTGFGADELALDQRLAAE